MAFDNYYDFKDAGFENYGLHIDGVPGTLIVKVSDVRIDRNTIPGDYEYYEIGSDDDDGFDPCRISRSVLVNFWGSMVYKTYPNGKLPLDNRGVLWLDGDKNKLEPWR